MKPTRAFLLRVVEPFGYSDALSVKAVLVLDLRDNGLALVMYREGSAIRREYVKQSALHSTVERAETALRPLLSALLSRAPNPLAAATAEEAETLSANQKTPCPNPKP